MTNEAKGEAEIEREFHRQTLLVSGFLGAICFAGLILVLQSDRYREPIVAGISGEAYLTALTLLLSGTCFLLTMASVGMIRTGSGDVPLSSPLGKTIHTFFILGVMALFFIVPLLVAPVGPVAFAGTVAIELVVFLAYEIAYWRS